MKVKYIGAGHGNFTKGEIYNVVGQDDEGDYFVKDNFNDVINEYSRMFEISKMEFKQLSDWIIINENCATRIKLGGDADNVADRIAFIEKTPRVRISSNRYGVEIDGGWGGVRGLFTDAWLSGEKGSDYGFDINSRKWCDDILVLLGWE